MLGRLRQFATQFRAAAASTTTAAATATAMTPEPSTTTSPATTEFATLAAGCFWGVEHLYLKHYRTKGIVSTAVGYAQGASANPTYKQVCSGTTNHAEVLRVEFDPAKVSYEELVTFFFRIHDPTTVNRQGPDVGTQYRSGIYTENDAQRQVAEAVKAKVQKYFNAPIATEIQPLTTFWPAEEYHQKYLIKNPSGYECPSHFVREFRD
ncbi:Peptide methionine sulfoxide reductase [Blastocladiella emersonii ATCC 22665]|nr:Peptide methionine sulfoxide reductase [Blastocladiella emersonii ATCC 22665]